MNTDKVIALCILLTLFAAGVLIVAFGNAIAVYLFTSVVCTIIFGLMIYFG